METENQKNFLFSNVFSIWVVLLTSMAPCTSVYQYRDVTKILVPGFIYRYVYACDNIKCLKLFHFSVNNPAFDYRLYLVLIMIAITGKALMFLLQCTITVCVRLTQVKKLHHQKRVKGYHSCTASVYSGVWKNSSLYLEVAFYKHSLSFLPPVCSICISFFLE